MKISIPELSLVLLVGPSGSGKSSFARKHFLPTEVVSSDFCRALVSDNENDQSATGDAFDLLHEIVRKRLARGRLTVVDATNVQPEARKSLIALAKGVSSLSQRRLSSTSRSACVRIATCFDPTGNSGRTSFATSRSNSAVRLRGLEREGIRHVFKLSSPEEVDAVTIERHPLWNNKKTEHGPFDIIGDVHGCFDELVELMAQLGYTVNQNRWWVFGFFLGRPQAGLCGRPCGSRPRDCSGTSSRFKRGAIWTSVLCSGQSRHEARQSIARPRRESARTVWQRRWNNSGMSRMSSASKSPSFSIVLSATMSSMMESWSLLTLASRSPCTVADQELCESLPSLARQQERRMNLVLPVRYNWAADYRGKALVVYGHTPVPEPLFLNNTVNIDTGCVFGGQLTALRYPEREIVSVKAHQTYYEPARPFLPEATESQRPLQHAQDDVLDLADVVGKRLIDTRLKPKITIREENAIAALEVMSRFASDPKWLIYLPPTMSPTETSKHENLLEHPDEAFAFYRKEGIATVVCEQKHMGSRAVVVLCKDETVSQKRFGVVQASLGTVYTRTGRRFFTDEALEHQFLARLQSAVERSGLWEELATDWLCLDCELMPWSAKAQELLQKQYAPVGNAGVHALRAESELITKALLRVPGLESLSANKPLNDSALSSITPQPIGNTAGRSVHWPISNLHHSTSWQVKEQFIQISRTLGTWRRLPSSAEQIRRSCSLPHSRSLIFKMKRALRMQSLGGRR